MATSTRESRRRNILERGSDRLALIVGQIQNLPPHSRDQTDRLPPPPLVHHDQDPPPNFSSQAAASASAHDKNSSPVLLKEDASYEADQSHTIAYNGRIGEGSITHRGGTNIETSKDHTSDTSGEASSLPVSLDDQNSFISTSRVVQNSETRSQKQNLFTPKQISYAIDASEKTRLRCSVIVAVLVMLSHLGFPLLGNRFLGSIISFRPLYFILLTNVTLVITRLLHFDHRGSSQRARREEHKATSADDYNLAEQLSKTLEVGLVTKKVIDAVFMDCSVYAIIVICGLSFT